jgi:hypothetical protein
LPFDFGVLAAAIVNKYSEFVHAREIDDAPSHESGNRDMEPNFPVETAFVTQDGTQSVCTREETF